MWAHHCEGRDLGPWAVKAAEERQAPAGGLAGPRLGPCDRRAADSSPGQSGGGGWGGLAHGPGVCLSAVLPACS